MSSYKEKRQKIENIILAFVNCLLKLHFDPQQTGVEIKPTPRYENECLLSFSVDGYTCIERRFSVAHLQSHTSKAINEINNLCQKARQIRDSIKRFNISANGYHPIDMGTGILWANKNIGADGKDIYGQLFAWGETESKTFTSHICRKNTSLYDRPHYKFAEGEKLTLTKYYRHSTLNQPDNKTRLEPADDAATQLMGKQWRMPTQEEFLKLLKSCDKYFVRTPLFEPNYYVLESRINGERLIFPADVRYWTADLADTHDTCAHAILYQWSYSNRLRWRAMYIRAVCKK